jgi:hypothetical protein
MDVKFWRDDPKFTQEDLHKLDQWLQEFLAYRSNEERYLEKERTYKVNLFNYLATIWDRRHSDPDESRQMLTRFMCRRYDEFRSVRTAAGSVAHESLCDYIRNEGFIFPDWLITDYVLSLATKPFVILSGISGTGKTKLPQLVADYLRRITGGQAGKAQHSQGGALFL